MIRILIILWMVLLSTLAGAQDSCSKTCVISSQCGTGGVCQEGLCKYQKSFCFNERWAANERGESANCDAYRCAPEKGICLREAQSSTDCLNGYVFDGKQSCVPSVNCNPASPQCQELLDRWKAFREEYESLTPAPVLAPLTCLACEDSSACGAGQMCWEKRCVAAAAYCQVSADGAHYEVSSESKSCGLFACEKVTGKCLQTCLKESDCKSGTHCLAGNCQ